MSRLLCVLVVSLGLMQCAVAQDRAQADGFASDASAMASAPDAASASTVPQIRAISDLLTQKFGLARAKAEQISAAVMSSASKYSLPPALVLAIISIESRFKEKAKGLHGATGLMQVVPAAHKQLVKHLDLTAPEDNIEAGSAILHGYIQSTQGDVAAALKNYGGSKAYAQKVSLRAKDFQLDTAASDPAGSR
ncbi:lytic transglycosylase [Trinickia terrae]|uniref:Lytic transglycosylase n=1 Tax=Trinickia terrae TaxID=2571161 RepID=A0A4U1I865_9BURK|nr:transglycosylase SLT domain-containing protein [Trinickia terrae]TKC89628.1 lytic transglycosylase [Trinickia terrae]